MLVPEPEGRQHILVPSFDSCTPHGLVRDLYVCLRPARTEANDRQCGAMSDLLSRGIGA